MEDIAIAVGNSKPTFNNWVTRGHSHVLYLARAKLTYSKHWDNSKVKYATEIVVKSSHLNVLCFRWCYSYNDVCLDIWVEVKRCYRTVVSHHGTMCSVYPIVSGHPLSSRDYPGVLYTWIPIMWLWTFPSMNPIFGQTTLVFLVFVLLFGRPSSKFTCKECSFLSLSLLYLIIVFSTFQVTVLSLFL